MTISNDHVVKDDPQNIFDSTPEAIKRRLMKAKAEPFSFNEDNTDEKDQDREEDSAATVIALINDIPDDWFDDDDDSVDPLNPHELRVLRREKIAAAIDDLALDGSASLQTLKDKAHELHIRPGRFDDFINKIKEMNKVSFENIKMITFGL